MRLALFAAGPALCGLGVLWLAGLPAAPGPVAGGAPPPARHPRVVVLGIDGLDPGILRETIAAFPERMPNFAALVEQGGLHALGTSTPPQSPVAWSNFITGLDPGGHGIFDFIHRDPLHRTAIPSTTVADEPGQIGLPGVWKFPLGGDAESNRTGEAFWRILARAGVPADVWRMPANFPVEPAEGLSFSGMMTPALDSAYGQFTFYSTDPPAGLFTLGQKIVPIQVFDDRVKTRLTGPPNLFKDGDPPVEVPLTIFVDRKSNAAAIEVGTSVVVLEPGEWSDFVPVSFDLLPAYMLSISGIVRFYLRSLEPEVELYVSAVNIDPASPVMPVSAPESASAQVADRRTGIGPYYTQGMPEDVNALKSEVLTVPEFLQQAALVHDEGERMLDWALDHWLSKTDGGLLFFYFSTIDLCMHMVWRHGDERHPHHDPAFAARSSEAWSGRQGSTWKEVTADLYMKMDAVLGHLRERLGEDVTLIVMSDHGFAPYHRKFSLNTWLLEQGYLVLKPGQTKELPETDAEHKPVYLAGAVDWTRTRAYGVGFNGLYLNLAGRELDDPKTPESEAGIVQAGEAPALLAELKQELEAITDAGRGGARVVLRADLARDVYTGERVAEAPDILVGYDSGYDNSDESSLARIPNAVLADNLGGTFNGSHLMSPDVVPGVLISNRRVLPGAHRLEDLTVEVLAQYGQPPAPGMRGQRVLAQP
jgi:predicted AlkP superfamily phosphohydrolase/phosphomutase